MSDLIYTRLPTLAEDQPLDVGALTLAANNATNLLKYWQTPLFNFSWYAGHDKPSVTFDSTTGDDNYKLVAFLGTHWRSQPYKKITGAFKITSTNPSWKGRIQLHVASGGGHPYPDWNAGRVGWWGVDVNNWDTIPETEISTSGEEHEQISVWIVIYREDGNATITLDGLALYWRV